MSRRQRRKIEQTAKKRLDRLELEKKHITKKVIAQGYDNPFDEVFYSKNFLIGHYNKSGLKMAPKRHLSILMFSITHRYDTLIIGFPWYALVIKNWAMRSKRKPKGAIGKFTFKWVKNGKKND
jgi:hypothetical protein